MPVFLAGIRRFPGVWCTPGMIMRATSLLAVMPSPSEAQIVSGMNGNVSLDGTYPRVPSKRRPASLALHDERGGVR